MRFAATTSEPLPERSRYTAHGSLPKDLSTRFAAPQPTSPQRNAIASAAAADPGYLIGPRVEALGRPENHIVVLRHDPGYGAGASPGDDGPLLKEGVLVRVDAWPAAQARCVLGSLASQRPCDPRRPDRLNHVPRCRVAETSRAGCHRSDPRTLANAAGSPGHRLHRPHPSPTASRSCAASASLNAHSRTKSIPLVSATPPRISLAATVAARSMG